MWGKKKMKNNKILIVLIIGTFIVSSIGGFLGAGEKSNITDYTTKSYTDSIVLSKANIVDKENFEIVELNGAESNIYSTGKPIIPVVTKTFTAPAGSRLIDSQISIEWETIILDKQIQPAEQALPMTTDEVTFGYQKSTFDSSIYSSTALYPTEPYTVTTGSGIQGTDHVLFINVRVNAQYSPANNYINVPKNIEIKLNVEEPLIPLFSTNVYDLLIITDVKFKEQMDRLAAHKNSIGIKTKVTTTDEIYPNYDGVADWEDIKLYLADVVKEWGVDYVLLAGGHKGQTNEWYIPEFLSHNFDEAYSGGGVAYDLTYAADLYYADVYYYNQYGQPVMDNWDSNKNGIYAEGPFYKDSYDVPDYYPDVHIGRIPLRYSWEANIIVDKIIEYESNAADPSWFKKGILCGGDTTPPARYEGATQGVYEGEMSGDLGAEYLSSIDFSTTKCYTSNNGDIVLTDPDLFTSIISEGCGWVQMHQLKQSSTNSIQYLM
jgi:hypothetical protein